MNEVRFSERVWVSMDIYNPDTTITASEFEN
jgi:hypothetical protein